MHATRRFSSSPCARDLPGQLSPGRRGIRARWLSNPYGASPHGLAREGWRSESGERARPDRRRLSVDRLDPWVVSLRRRPVRALHAAFGGPPAVAPHLCAPGDPRRRTVGLLPTVGPGVT